MSAPYQITGVVIPDATPRTRPPPRLDICDMREKHPKQFTLFFLSLTEIMKPTFQPRAASFHEIAGIHGMPYAPWLGDPDEARQTLRGPWLGYCNHRSILFPSWHRPYLLLLEQIICDVALGIASEFANLDSSKAKEWKDAAEELRFPFWDWTHDRTRELGIPEILRMERIRLEVPPGKPDDYQNVLAYYELGYVDGFDNRQGSNRVYQQSARAYFREWKRTYRHPDSQAMEPRENYDKIDALLKSEDVNKLGTWANLRRDVSGIFGFPPNIAAGQRANAWDQFSNTIFQSGHRNPADPKDINSPYHWRATSIEQSHNTVHLVLGGIGHMSDNDTAGFDPIFFLHHCNVDRLLAFWEHIYPDYAAGTQGFLDIDGVTRRPFTQGGGTWIETNHQVVDDRSSLPPFRNSDYNYWTSQDGRSLLYYYDDRSAPVSPINKYYTYPPIIHKGHEIKIDTDPTNLTPLAVREKQRAYLQQHFGYNPKEARDSTVPLFPDIFKKTAPYSGDDGPIPGRKPLENYREFVIVVSLDPRLVKGSHILVISAKIPRPSEGLEHPGTLREGTYEIGRVSVLARGSSEKCGNCQAQEAGAVRIHATVLIPHLVVASIVQNSNQNWESTNDGASDQTSDKLIQTIWLCLEPALVMPDGTPHSKLQEYDPKQSEHILTGDALPHFEIWSCDVYQESEEVGDEVGEDVPYDFDDWKRHILPLESEATKRQWF